MKKDAIFGSAYFYSFSVRMHNAKFLQLWITYFLIKTELQWTCNGILFLKLFCSVRKNCSSDWEKIWKWNAESREFANFLRSLEQLIQVVKGQNNFWNRMFFNLFLEVSQIWYIRIQTGKNNWDLETCRKS